MSGGAESRACRATGAVVQWRAVSRHPQESELWKFRKRLLGWFRRNRRELPWRRTRSAYAVWVSETMLQQTRAAAVLPRYRSFLRAFPSLKALARAGAVAVLREWSGLGYYSRARNLHRAAKIIVLRHNGRFPGALEQALALPGVGSYTARAVLSIAYGAPHAVLDGNVARVIARREAIEGDLRASERWRRLQTLADDWLAREAPGDWNQAMMELGATVCTPRNPRCGACPVRAGCRAYRLGVADRLPERRGEPRPVRMRIAAIVLLDRRARTLLVPPAESGAIFSRLWQFPAIEAGGNPREELERYLEKEFALAPERWEALPTLRHTVTFRLITLEGWLAHLPALPPAGPARIVALDRVAEMAVSSATRKLAQAALGRLTERESFPLALLHERAYPSLSKLKGAGMGDRIDLPQGTLDLLILRTLALGPQHGWAISERIHQVSSKVLRIQQGSLYPALHRLERRGWIKARWAASENNRRAKFYELTRSGRKQLETEQSDWRKLTAAIAQVLGEA